MKVSPVVAWSMNIRPIVAWYDFWIGVFWDVKNRRLYLFPVPMLGIVFTFRKEVKR